MFDIKVIGSSSKGNSYLLLTKDESLIIEAGVKYQEILRALSFKLSNVVGCLISHEHKDHSGFVKNIIKAGINVYASAGTFEEIGIKSHRVKTIEATKQFKIGNFTVLPFDVQHDAKEPYGYLIQHAEVGKLLFITDSFYCKYKFNGLNIIMIECNYSRAIVDENLRSGLVEKAQVRRLFKSHFSLERVKEFLLANDLSVLQKIYLMHLSDRNSNAELFRTEIQKLTGIPVEVC